MDPKIAAGFNILGNALMPDPRAMASAEIMRSQMLQNQAQTGKLTAETEAIRRTAEQLALLQDLLAGGRATPEDIISRGVGAGIANDPSQIPQFALGTIGTRGLDINDPSSFSKALLATGTVANQAATPEGFAADQARQAAQAAAADSTTQRGQNLVHDASIYNTDVDAATSIETQRMEDLRQIAITTADRDLEAKVQAAQLAKDYYDINKDSNDAAIRLGAEERWKQSQRALDASIANNADATKVDIANREIAGRAATNEATLANTLTRQGMIGDTAVKVQETENAGDLAVQNAKDAAAGTAGPKFSYGDTKNFQTSVRNRMALSVDPNVDLTDKNARNKLIQGINVDDWDKVVQLAMTLHPDNPIAQVELGMELFKYNKETGKWRFRRKAYNNYLNGYHGPGDTSDDTAGDTEEPNPPIPDAAVPDTTREPDGDKAMPDGTSKPVWSDDGINFFFQDGTPAN